MHGRPVVQRLGSETHLVLLLCVCVVDCADAVRCFGTNTYGTWRKPMLCTVMSTRSRRLRRNELDKFDSMCWLGCLAITAEVRNSSLV